MNEEMNDFSRTQYHSITLEKDLNDWKSDLEYIVEHCCSRDVKQRAVVALYEINQRLDDL